MADSIKDFSNTILGFGMIFLIKLGLLGLASGMPVHKYIRPHMPGHMVIGAAGQLIRMNQE